MKDIRKTTYDDWSAMFSGLQYWTIYLDLTLKLGQYQEPQQMNNATRVSVIFDEIKLYFASF